MHYARVLLSAKDPGPTSMMSSTNIRCVMLKRGLIFIPFISLEPFALRISVLSPSITSRKRRGDSGHPCLRPQEASKKYVGFLLISIAKENIDTQLMIHFIIWKAMSIRIKISLRKPQGTLS